MGEVSGANMWHLPSEVLVLIFSFLPAEDVGRAASVCSRWSQVAEDRRVWRGKSFLSEGSRGLSDSLPIVKALPVLKRVSICWGKDLNVYLSGESADFVVPDLREEVVTSAISTLVTEDLSVDFYLLEEQGRNCLVVQLHKLKELKVGAKGCLLPLNTVAAKLRALGDTLSCEPLSNLLAVDVRTDSSSMSLDENVDSDIMGALSTCPALERVTINTHCFLTWHVDTEFSKLQSLQLQNSTIEDVSFLDLCPNLHSLSLDKCSLLGWREVSHTSELRSLILRHLSVTTEFVEKLCNSSPNLERIDIDECPDVVHTLFLGQCLQLCSVEVKEFGETLVRVAGLPSGLLHLSLDLPRVTSDSLAEILQGVPRLEILDIINCNIESLSFLRHCSHLLELNMACSNTFRHLYELGGLRDLKKLRLCYNDTDVGPLADTLCKMPQVEVLTVFFTKSVSDLSFLRYCHQLHCLILRFYVHTSEECFHELSNLKELRKLTLIYKYLGVKDLVAVLPSLLHLEELRIGCLHTECNFSFLRHCRQLTSFQISCRSKPVSHLTQLRQLECLRRLTVTGLSYEYVRPLAEEVMRLPKLEYLSLEEDGPNFLESSEWRKMIFSPSSSIEN